MSFDPITHATVKALEKEVQSLKIIQSESRKPLRVTEYTSGTGMHSFLPESVYQHVLLIGAGGGGGYGYRNFNGYNYWGSGGAAGDEMYRRIAIKGSQSYQVGAGGTGNGGATRLGALWAGGGVLGNSGRTDMDATYTTISTRQGHGITPGNQGTLAGGGDSLLGKGGINATPAAGSASGYGAGGGGTYGYIGPTTPSPGTGGYIRIEEY